MFLTGGIVMSWFSCCCRPRESVDPKTLEANFNAHISGINGTVGAMVDQYQKQDGDGRYVAIDIRKDIEGMEEKLAKARAIHRIAVDKVEEAANQAPCCGSIWASRISAGLTTGGVTAFGVDYLSNTTTTGSVDFLAIVAIAAVAGAYAIETFGNCMLRNFVQAEIDRGVFQGLAAQDGNLETARMGIELAKRVSKSEELLSDTTSSTDSVRKELLAIAELVEKNPTLFAKTGGADGLLARLTKVVDHLPGAAAAAPKVRLARIVQRVIEGRRRESASLADGSLPLSLGLPLDASAAEGSHRSKGNSLHRALQRALSEEDVDAPDVEAGLVHEEEEKDEEEAGLPVGTELVAAAPASATDAPKTRLVAGVSFEEDDLRGGDH